MLDTFLRTDNAAGIHEIKSFCSYVVVSGSYWMHLYLTFHAVVKSGLSSNRVQVISTKAEEHKHQLLASLIIYITSILRPDLVLTIIWPSKHLSCAVLRTITKQKKLKNNK